MAHLIELAQVAAQQGRLGEFIVQAAIWSVIGPFIG